MAKKEALKSHVEHSILGGTMKKDVRQVLISSGWPQRLVDEHLKSIAKKVKNLERLPASAMVMVNGISKKFNGRNILQNISMEIAPGEIFGVIGLSGTGKTTLLNLLVGFLEPDSGDVLIKLPNGVITSIVQSPALVKTLFGFSTQDPSFYSKLTVKENMLHFGALYGINTSKLIAKADDLLELVGLSNSKDVIAQNLSGGMQKRLDIACAMVHEPKVLILDEPTADLDPLLRKQMWNLVQKINARGTTIIVASHFVAEIEAVCDRIAVLNNRTIADIGTVEELINAYSKDYALSLETKSHKYEQLAKGISRLRSVVGHKTDGKKLILNTKNPKQTITWISSYMDHSKDQIIKMNLSKPTLAQVFETIVKQ